MDWFVGVDNDLYLTKSGMVLSKDIASIISNKQGQRRFKKTVRVILICGKYETKLSEFF